MVRYRRYKRYGSRRNSTNVIKMKFQTFMDISTSDTSMQIITVSAGGPEILRRLSPQFGAYKYYKIGNIAIKLVPASTLPVDPTGLSYEAGEPTVDPRDQLTPGMMRITNGEDVFENLAGMADADQHAIYNNMLLDPRWFKWSLQSGVKRHATPRYWQIGQLHQDKWPGAIMNYPYFDDKESPNADTVEGTYCIVNSVKKGVGTVQNGVDVSSPYGLFQTGHRGVLGWMPTDGLQPIGGIDAGSKPLVASPPEVEVMKIIMPKAYKTRYYYRMFITETVYFKEPIVNFGLVSPSGSYYRPLDVFHQMQGPFPVMPDSSVSTNFPNDSQTGGNYGDN